MEKRFATNADGLHPILTGLLATATLLFFPVRLAAQIPEPPSLAISLHYYDLEQRAGYRVGPNQGDPLLEGSFIEAYLPGSSTPDFVAEDSLSLFEDLPYSAQGQPFFYRCVIPPVGVFEGTGVITSMLLYASCLPVTSEQVGRELELPGGPLVRPGGVVPDQDFGLGVQCWVTNGFDYAGAVGPAETVGLGNRACSVTIEYLPGNTLEPLGSSTRILAVGGLQTKSLYWGTYYPEGTDPGEGIYPVGRVVPEGPLRVTAFIDGYQVDQIELNASNHTAYFWRSLFRPRRDRPDAKRPPSSYTFAPVPISREVERGILDANARTHILMDDNRDGVIDIADLVHARRNE